METKKKVNGIINIPASIKGSFFRHWLEFLLPFHHLTEREMDVATAFLKRRHELSKAIKDDAVLDNVVMSEESKKKIREECNLAAAHFQVIMGKLKKANFLVEGKVNPKFVPKNLNDGDKSFQLLLYFSLDAGDN